MADYIIWQGKSSSSVKGLLVKESIKHFVPGKRLSESMVDGRSFAVVTDNGYDMIDIDVTFMTVGIPECNGAKGRDAIDQFLFGASESLYYNAKAKNTLVLSTEPNYWYEAYISGEVNYEQSARLGTFSVTFHCQPLKKPYRAASGADNVYKLRISADQTWDGATKIYSLPTTLTAPMVEQTPAIVLLFDYAEKDTVFSNAFTITIESANKYRSEYCGRMFTINMPAIHTAFPLLAVPAIVLNFETDDYYVCEQVGEVTDDASYYLNTDRKVGSITKYLLSYRSLTNSTYDLYYDVDAEDTRIHVMCMWHDIKFRDKNTQITLAHLSGSTALPTTHVVFFPNARFA